MNRNLVLLISSLLLLSGCGSSEKVKDEEYQFAGGLKLLDVPPDLTRPDKNLVMEIPKPSLKACQILMEADRKFKLEKAKKEAEEKAAKAKKGQTQEE